MTQNLSLHFDPLLAWWALPVLAVACLGALAVRLALLRRGVIWRTLAALTVLLWLSGPNLVTRVWKEEPQTLLVMLDRSDSMNIAKRALISQAAEKMFRDKNHITARLGVRIIPFSNKPGQGTQLFEALERARADTPAARLAGIMVLSDGEIHDIPPDIQRYACSGAGNKTCLPPVYLFLPAAKEETDRRVRFLQLPSYTVVGKPVDIKVQVDDLGAPPGKSVMLSVRINGQTAKEIPVVTGRPQQIRLPPQNSGKMIVEISAPPLEGEVSLRNNHMMASVQGIRDRLRVLLISGTPNQGERVWRRLLKSDPSVDLVHFTILRSAEKDDGTPLSDLALIPFPVRELFFEKIKQFDLVIMDGFANTGIIPPLYLETMADYVREGGGIFLISGPEFAGGASLQNSPLREIFPAQVTPDSALVEQEFRPRLTEKGERHPVTRDLQGSNADPHAQPAWGPWYRMLRGQTTRGDVLLRGPRNLPLLVLDHVEKGRIAMLLSDQIWLWSRGEKGGGPQAELLRRVSHWLMKEPELEENRLRAYIKNGRLDVVRSTLSPSQKSSVTVTAPDGSSTNLPLQPGKDAASHAHMPASQPGVWSVTDQSTRVFVASSAGDEDDKEHEDLRATATHLAPLLKATGGRAYWLGDSPEHVRLPEIALAPEPRPHATDERIELPEKASHTLEAEKRAPLLPPGAVLAVLLLCVLAAWWREGRR